MYQLQVYFPGDTAPRATVPCDRAAGVMLRIPQLLADHDGCEVIVVRMGGLRLFSVDCEGHRLP